jgi:serine/threonine protein kinase
VELVPRITPTHGCRSNRAPNLAEDIELGRQVAIKFLNADLDLVQDETARKRLLREAQAAAKLDHRHICPVFEVRHEADQTFIVMAYVKGETLASHLQKRSLKLSECTKF